MKNRRYLAILMACVLAFGMLALAGCGGGNSSSASGSSSASEATGPTDEELITADVENIFARIFTPDTIKTLIASSAGDALTQMEQAGITIDYDAMAEAFKNVITVKVDSVQVNGDTAVANVTISYPDYNDPSANQVMESVMTEKLADVDASMLQNDPDAVSKLLNEAIIAGLTSSDIPVSTQTDAIEYVKNGDTWAMKDADELEETLKSYGL